MTNDKLAFRKSKTSSSLNATLRIERKPVEFYGVVDNFKLRIFTKQPLTGILSAGKAMGRIPACKRP